MFVFMMLKSFNALIMDSNERIKRVVDYLKTNKLIRNQQHFVELVGSDRSTISQIINNKIAAPNNMFGKIIDAFPYINAVWLLTGEGGMLKANAEDEALKVESAVELVPELPLNAAAGFTDDIQSGITPSMCNMLPRIPGLPKYDLTMHVRGDSMHPTFESGDRLAIRRCFDFVEWGVPHVLDTTEGVYLKRIREDSDNIICISDNDDYPQFLIPKNCIRGIYKVVAMLRVC